MSRVIFILVTVFWLVMNVLLWRMEFGSPKSGGTVSADVVWEKILTAPDDSSLNVLYHEQRIGFCRWRTGVGEAWSHVSDENIPSGLPAKSRGYNLRAEGSVIFEEASTRLRFEADLQLDRHHELRQMKSRLTMRPTVWDVICTISNQIVELSVESENGSLRRTFSYADLQNPGTVAMQLFEPLTGSWPMMAALPELASHKNGAPPTLTWDASTDWTQIGHTPVQIYRLHTQVMRRFDINILVSRAGEILRIELPNDITLVNDQLHSL